MSVHTPKKLRMILFPGLGADASMFKLMQQPDLEIGTPPLIEPNAEESLSSFAHRIGQATQTWLEQHWQQKMDDTIIGGSSFGGMIASEIAHQFKVKQLILLGSTQAPEKVKTYMRMVECIGQVLPSFAINAGRRIGKKVLSKMRGLPDEASELFLHMGDEISVNFLRQAGRMIFEWKGVTEQKYPVLHLHDPKDLIIAPPDYGYEKMEGVGHAFPLTHPRETVEILRKKLE